MKVLELFEPTTVGKMGRSDSMRYDETKIIGDYEITFAATNGGHHGWEVWFIAADKEGNSSWDATKSGNEIKVFSFVVNAMRNFIKKHDPERIIFSSKKVEGSRTALYRKFVDRFLKDRYITREFEVGLGNAEKTIEFDLIKKPSGEGLK